MGLGKGAKILREHSKKKSNRGNERKPKSSLPSRPGLALNVLYQLEATEAFLIVLIGRGCLQMAVAKDPTKEPQDLFKD